MLDPPKSESYRTVEAMGFWSILSRRIRRFLRLSFWSLVTYCLSLIPFVGWMVIPLAQFYLVSKVNPFCLLFLFSLTFEKLIYIYFVYLPPLHLLFLLLTYYHRYLVTKQQQHSPPSSSSPRSAPTPGHS